jgi:hypothetical protein
MTKLDLEFAGRPSVAAYMLRALYPGFLRRGRGFPTLRARWRGLRPDSKRLGHFLRLTGLDAEDGLPVLYPQVLTFPLQMVLLTHPACPQPIWKVLQVRNHLLRHRPVPVDAVLDAEAALVAQRIVERGLEIDLHVVVRSRDERVWEGMTSYRYRGRHGPAGPDSPLATAAIGETRDVSRWRTGSAGGLHFSGLSGDYNGIHYWSPYSRLFGFKAALHHPHAVVGQCQARMAALRATAQRLDLWFKGPVYYGTDVVLAEGEENGSVAFTLREQDSSRPALVGRWSEAAPGEQIPISGSRP